MVLQSGAADFRATRCSPCAGPRRAKQVDLDIRRCSLPAWGLRTIPGLEISVDGRIATVDGCGATTRLTVPVSKHADRVITVDPQHKWLLQARVERAP